MSRSRSRGVRDLAATSGFALAALACGEVSQEPAAPPVPAPEAAAPSGHNVFLISLDAAAARFFESYGAEAGSTPHIRRFAREAVVFENAYSQSATTVSSVASLLTGLRGTTHRVEPRTMEPVPGPTLVERLRDHGYRGFGFIANPMAGLPRLGFHRGYEVYQQVYARPHGVPAENPDFAGTPYKLVYPEDLNAELAQVLAAFRPSHTFAYFHYLQPHTPYDPPERFREDGAGGDAASRGLPWPDLEAQLLAANERGSADRATIDELAARYRANLRYADAGVGALFEALRRADLYEESLIVVTADHGEAFFEHGRFGHNDTLYEEMVRVPLIARFPTSLAIAPRRIANPTETIDLLPTLLDFLGLPLPAEREGESLWPLVRGERRELARPEVVLATAQRNLHAIRVGPYKLIVDPEGGAELYDLSRDPDERHDLAASEAETADLLYRRLTSRVDVRSGESRDAAPDLALDPGLRDLLETLGYAEVLPPRE